MLRAGYGHEDCERRIKGCPISRVLPEKWGPLFFPATNRSATEADNRVPPRWRNQKSTEKFLPSLDYAIEGGGRMPDIADGRAR